MPADRANLWGSGDAYERYMGRWSALIAVQFLDWLAIAPESAWVDIGCGTGALSAAIVARHAPRSIVGVDSAAPFLEQAAARIGDARFSVQQGAAEALPCADHAHDVAVSGLVLNFVTDKAKAVTEQRRVVRAGGTVAAYVWDYAGHMQIMRHFFDAAIALDARARDFDDGIRAPVCRPAALRQLFEHAGLAAVEVRAIDIAAAFDDFDAYWQPFLGGTGSAPRYCASLAPEARERLRERLQARLPTGPDGEILLAVRAWAVRGQVS
jgi:trans-aconitate methyltransferase